MCAVTLALPFSSVSLLKNLIKAFQEGMYSSFPALYLIDSHVSVIIIGFVQ